MRKSVLLLASMALALLMASEVALAVSKVGTNGHDVLKGTDGKDNLLGLGGQDDLFGKGGEDNLVGGDGKDNVLGGDERRPGGGDKNLDGGKGNDVVAAGRCSDNASGGDGNDFLIDGNLREGSRDNVVGGDGGDVIVVDNVPAAKDVVACGSGFDRVLADRKDTVAKDCERVKVVRGSRQEVIEQEEAFFESIPRSFFRGLPPRPSN